MSLLRYPALSAGASVAVRIRRSVRVHVLPTLHQIEPGDLIRAEVMTPVGTLLVEQGSATEGFLCVRLPSGEVRRFAQREHQWFEIVSSQVDAQAARDDIPLRSPPAFDTSVARDGKCWTSPGDPRFLSKSGKSGDLITLQDREHIAFGPHGELVVQNRRYPPGSSSIPSLPRRSR